MITAVKPVGLRRAFVKNATVNVIRLAAFSLVALCLPPLLVHRLSKETYAAWVLIMQLSAYVTFFDFGMQSAVSHFITYTEEKRDLNERDRILSSAVWLLGGLAGIGVLLIVGLV
jgi:O-antigen/teichoic acid export membrane protein